MGEFLNDNWVKVILAVIALFAIGIAINVRIRRKNTKVTQNNNKVGGDMAGRDINKDR